MGRLSFLGTFAFVVISFAGPKKTHLGIPEARETIPVGKDSQGEDVRRIRANIFLKEGKLYGKILSILPKDAYYYFTNAQIPRALPAGELIDKAKQYDLKGEQCDEVNMALQSAIAHATPEDLIIVCGSVFVVGEVELSIEKSSAGDPDLTHF